MRTLTGPTITAANSDSSMPYCLLQITFPAPVGVKWYAQEDFGSGDGSHWNDAQGRVLEWGQVRIEIKGENRVNVAGDCTIRLRDEDKALFGYFQQCEPQRSRVTIYQAFRGGSASDLVAVHAGIVNAPCTWSERDHAVTLDVTDISTYFDRTVGNFADRLDYPNVVQTDENKVIPLVFGHVKRARAVALNFGPVTELARQVGYYDMGLYVNDAEKFPQNTAIQIWVGGERINGQFNGNFFSISERGGPVYTGTVTALGMDCQHFKDSALTGADGAWVGYYLQVTMPDGTSQRKIIASYDSATHTIGFGMYSGYLYVDPLDETHTQWMGDTLLNGSSIYTLPVGATYQICTNWSTHAAGSRLYLARSSYTYVVNDAPSKQVYYVEGYGHPIIYLIAGPSGPYNQVAPEEWYCVLNPTLYTVNRNDTTTCPGRAVTSVTFNLPPSQVDSRLKNDDLFITLDGVESAGDGTGTLLQNPADVIQAIHSRWMGMPADNIDADSFLAAKIATAPLQMGFALTQQKNGLALCADLAFQARCAEVFFAGKAKLIYLTNVMSPAGTPPTTGADRYLGSLDIARREWNQIITEVTGAYVDNAIKETIIVRSAAAEVFVGGRRAKTIDFWAYSSLPPVQGVATFWLNRWQYIWQQIALVDSLRRLDAEPYDVLDLDLAGWFGGGQLGRVMGIEQTLGGGAGRRVPAIKLTAELPYFPAGPCDTLIEAMPPGGCWACENSCQLGCELFCTVQAMINNPITTSSHTSKHATLGHTPPNTFNPTLGPTDEGTLLGSAWPTEYWTTPPPTTPPTTPPGPTSPPTTPPGPTSPPTTPPGPTSPPTTPATAHYACDNCQNKTPRFLNVTSDNGYGGLLFQQGSGYFCVYSGTIFKGSDGQFVSVVFGNTNIAVALEPIGIDYIYEPAPHDCMATRTITILGPGGVETLTIIPD